MLDDLLKEIEELKRGIELLNEAWNILGPYACFIEKGLREDPKHTPVIVPGHLGCTDQKEFDNFMNKMQNYFKFDDSE